MKYKLVISDFDGTLFRSDKTISAATKQAIKQYQQMGGIFTIATGRMFASIRQYLQEAELGDVSIPVSSYQGHLINDSKTGEVLMLKAIDIETAAQIAKDFEDLGEYVHIYVMDSDGVDRLYVEKECDLVKNYAHYCKVPYYAVGKISSYIRGLEKNRHIMKILSFLKEEQIKGLSQIFSQKYQNRAEILSSQRYMLEAISYGSGKSEAAEFLCKHFGITQQQLICCGDAPNDISMIKYAGLGCAVQNAYDEVKAAADLIIPSNDDDGIAYVLTQYAIKD